MGAGSLLFLAAATIVGAAASGSLFAAGFVHLLQSKAAIRPAIVGTGVPPMPPGSDRAPAIAEAARSSIGAASTAGRPDGRAPLGAIARPPAAASPPDGAAPPRPAAEPPRPAVSAPDGAVLPPAATGSPSPAASPPDGGVPSSAVAAALPGPSLPEGGAMPRTAPPPRPTASSPDDAVRFALSQGDASFAGGELSVARFYYEQAAAAGNADAAVRMGETFDPAFLQRDQWRRVRGDPAAARFWYNRALGLGASEAKQRLDDLDAGPDATRATSETRRYVLRRRARAASQYESSGAAFHRILERILHPRAADETERESRRDQQGRQ
jgi:hypothetical protein